MLRKLAQARVDTNSILIALSRAEPCVCTLSDGKSNTGFQVDRLEAFAVCISSYIASHESRELIAYTEYDIVPANFVLMPTLL